ncbi:MAG: hypothetical protein CMF69_01805 [Magnetovibrio sp.]|nr:hypothetical protein [Magnetovibrio sp.]
MMDDFFVRALLAGVGVAVIAGPFGCFIVWRRLAYFGDTIAHASLLGIAFALLIESNVTLTVFVVSATIAVALLLLMKYSIASADSLLGLLSHSALALGLVVLAFISWLRIDLMSFLFGDILAVSETDIFTIYIGGLALLGILAFIWRSLFAGTVNFELAEAEGMNPSHSYIIFIILMAAVISIAIKIVGVLLITALLIIPATTARRFVAGPEKMALMASFIGACSIVGGLFSSLAWDTPSGPSIVVIAFTFFLLSNLPIARSLFSRNSKPNIIDGE